MDTNCDEVEHIANMGLNEMAGEVLNPNWSSFPV